MDSEIQPQNIDTPIEQEILQVNTPSIKLILSNVLLFSLFIASLYLIRFKTIDHRLHNGLLDWGRVLLFLGFSVCFFRLLILSTKKYRLLQNILVSVIVTFLLLVIFEFGLRFTTTQYYWYGGFGTNYGRGIFKYDPEIGWQGIPNLNRMHYEREFNVEINHNSEGYRDSEFHSKNDDALKIMFLGDSYMWGWGVSMEQRFDTITRNILNESEIQTETYNTGMAAYDNCQEFLQLLRMADRIKPDYVVMQWCANDLECNGLNKIGAFTKPYGVLKDGKLVLEKDHMPNHIDNVNLVPELTFAQNVNLQFLKFSHAYRFFSYRYTIFSYIMNLPPKERNKFNEGVDRNDAEWAVTTSILWQVKEFCRMNNIKFILLLSPEQIHQKRWNQSFWYREVLTDFSEKHDFLLLDLEQDPKYSFKKLHYATDYHWNFRGHKVVGNALADLIEEQEKQK